MFVRKGNQHGTYGMERPHQTRLQGRISAPPRRDLAGDGQGFERGRHLQLQHFLYRLVISVLHPLSSRNTRSLALNPDIRPFQSFLFCATSGTLLFTGMKRLLLAAISCLLKKAPDSINTDRQIQRFNDFQTCDIRLFFQKRKDVLMICIGQFWLLSTEIRLSFVAARFVPTLQQTIDRTGIYRKALCQFLYADALIVSFQNQLSSFVVQHSTHIL